MDRRSLLKLSDWIEPGFSLQAQGDIDPAKLRFDKLAKTLYHVQEQYVDPDRVNPKDMFKKVLEYLSLGVAEVTDRHRQAVLDAWQQGTQRGVVGSPHFFTPNGAFFCPALDISRVDGHLRIRAKAGMFDEFLHAAFG